MYFNNSSSAKIAGTVNTTYCDVQGGALGTGNKSVNPGLRPGTLELLSTSPSIDRGNPDFLHNDFCFVPEPLSSRGTARNDMGAYGGPAACCWAHTCDRPVITCQPQPEIACIGSAPTLCVAATGDLPMRYQWRWPAGTSRQHPAPHPHRPPKL